MSSFRKRTMNVIRKTSQGYTDAFANPDIEEPTFTIKCSFQPLNPDEMQVVPEGRRDEEAFKVYTDTQLFTAESNGGNADIIIDELAQEYEVLSVGKYQNKVIPHYKVICVRIDSQ